MRRGQLSPSPEEIDLHGQDAREACDTIAAAIAHAQQMDRRSLCLIHGKGHHSESRGSRLKGLVDAVLREHSEVLGFHSVPGNTGAVNVLLRRSRK
ncbi:MAG: Smr/MutS family protein [Gammaproteobacteria bacterium]|nr:Smr/MutS family protein [Gammaproteobacteria bacterium]